MLHEMKLKEEPFAKIASGQKTIELRLYDKKRQAIKLGDEIVFSNLVTNQKLRTEVLKLHLFPDFETLYNTLPLEKCGYSADEILAASAEDMNKYYSPEEQSQFGVVGIEIAIKH